MAKKAATKSVRGNPIVDVEVVKAVTDLNRLVDEAVTATGVLVAYLSYRRLDNLDENNAKRARDLISRTKAKCFSMLSNCENINASLDKVLASRSQQGRGGKRISK